MSELDRIRSEYARRAADQRLRGRYSLFAAGELLMRHDRERFVLRALHRAGFDPLGGFDVFEVGCGEGGVMLDLLRWGADPARLFGCDLLPEHVAQARRRLPLLTRLTVADGGALPYSDVAFDLVLQFTLFTSVLNNGLRQRIAREMWRVLRPGGAVLWYDFRVQGRNPAVRAIRPREVRALFPRGEFTARRVTLAPPLARQLASWGWLGCEVLSRIPWLCTHDLILIRKPTESV